MTTFRRNILHSLGVAASLLALGASPAPFDLLLVNGTVADGTGGPLRRADVAVRGDRIAAVGPRLNRSSATRVLDVSGLVVSPGFIDPHAHITDIAQHPDAENVLRQGITTIFASLHGLDQPYPLGAFLDTVHVAPNTMWTAGHTWMRTRVTGLENRAPRPAELDTMRALVARAMDDGAFGLGTGLEYIPATYANTDELIALARAAKRPNALYVTHLRDEGAALMDAVREALEIGAGAELPVHISHIKSTGAENWGRSREVLALVDSARARGRRISFDVYPYPAYSTMTSWPCERSATGCRAARGRTWWRGWWS